MSGQENQLVALLELGNGYGNGYGQGALRCPTAWPGAIMVSLGLFALLEVHLQDLGNDDTH